MIRRSAATAAAACTSSSGFVRTLARGRPRGPARRREPRQALPQPPQPPPAEASPAVDVASATPINASDKRWAWASLVFGSLAIGGLTLNKWEIEKRLEGSAEKPPISEASAHSPLQHAPPAPDQAQGGLQLRPASVNWQTCSGWPATAALFFTHRLKELPPELEAQWRSGEYAEAHPEAVRALRAAQKPET